MTLDPLPPPRLPPVGARPGRRQHRPLRRRPPRRTPGPSWPSAATSPAGLAGGRPWMLMEHSTSGGQLAAGQPRQGPRPDDPRQPRPRGPRRRHHRLLPVAPVAGRARRSSTRPWCPTPAATARASARSCELGAIAAAARRAARQPRWRPRSRSCGTTRPSGRPPARPCRRSARTTPWSRQTVHRLLRDRGRHRRRRAPVRRPHGIPARRRAHPLPRHRRARRRHRGGCRGRRAGAGHLLLRDQRRATTTCGSAATPGRSATCSASGSRSSSRSLEDETVALAEGSGRARGARTSRRPRRQVLSTVRRRAARRTPRRHPTGRSAAGPRGTSAPCPTTTPSPRCSTGSPRLPGSGPACQRAPRRRGGPPSRHRRQLALPPQRHRRRAARRRDRPRPRRRTAPIGPAVLPPGGVAVVREA